MRQKVDGCPKSIVRHSGKVFRSLPQSQAGGIRVRFNRSRLEFALLERKIAQSERQVAAAVECCLAAIREQVDLFRSDCRREISLNLPLLLRADCSCEAILAKLINARQFLALEIALKKVIQQQLNQLYGMKSVNIAALHSSFADQAGLCSFAGAFSEYRRTVSLTGLMLKVSQLVWKKSMTHNGFPKPVGKLLGRVELANVFLEALGCLPQKRQLLDQRHLAARLSGIIDNYCLRLLFDLSQLSAEIFYQLYDDVFARPFFQRRALLLESLRTNRIPHPSPCFTKQAG